MSVKNVVLYILSSFIVLLSSFLPYCSCTCCMKTTGSCRDVCEQVMLLPVKNVSEKQDGGKLLDELNSSCPIKLGSFWHCINETLNHAKEYDHNNWPGKMCCNLAQSNRCSQACITANSIKNVQSDCHYKSEIDFYQCSYHRQIEGGCCRNAHSFGCYSACKNYFQDYTNSELSDLVNFMCNDISPMVVQCVKNFTKITSAIEYSPLKYMHCCEFISRTECKDYCQIIVRSKISRREIVKQLQNVNCDNFDIDDELWNCFHNEDVSSSADIADEDEFNSSVETVNSESAKLHCCLKAVSSQCRKLCFKIFSNKWLEASVDFNLECLSYTSEEALNYCLDEVDEPCELGCDGLNYCANFNDRSSQLFRSCSTESDTSARDDLIAWQSQGYLSMFGYQLPVKNITSCGPVMWKSMACILRIKPCHRFTHSTSLCSEDCYQLLGRCLDWSRISATITLSMLCERFSSEKSNTPCVSIQNFLEPHESDDSWISAAPSRHVSSPCRNNPCNNNGGHQVCMVNRNCQSGRGRTCHPYICTSGCKLGVASRYFVPENTLVYLPVTTKEKVCYKVCQCIDRKIEQCRYIPCFTLDFCWIFGRKIDHGSHFHIECNICSCFAGEVICTKKSCQSHKLISQTASSTLILCGCQLNYVPVCGRNGKTYPNSCIAKCSGFTEADFTYGACIGKDVCEESMCAENEICVPDRKVCLSSTYELCAQYRCVNVKRSCRKIPHEVVCDTDGHEHWNVCFMYKHQKILAYKGSCQNKCNKSGIVCGIDGNTYASECHAHSNMVSVDYKGSCVAVALIGEQPEQMCSAELVKCPELARTKCNAVTPPGACCPVCAGAIRILYSKKQVDRLLYSTRNNAMNSLSVAAIVKALERHVQTAECTVRGYLTHESDLFILVVPILSNPTSLQMDACLHEAEKLAVIIRKSSPRISSELSLSILTNAIMVDHDSRYYSTVTHAHSQSNASSFSSSSVGVIYLTSQFLKIFPLYLLWRIQV